MMWKPGGRLPSTDDDKSNGGKRKGGAKIRQSKAHHLGCPYSKRAAAPIRLRFISKSAAGWTKSASLDFVCSIFLKKDFWRIMRKKLQESSLVYRSGNLTPFVLLKPSVLTVLSYNHHFPIAQDPSHYQLPFLGSP